MKKFFQFLIFSLSFIVNAQVPLTRTVPQILGKYDFTAIGNTLNASNNPNPCVLLPQSSATLNLGPTQTFFQAHMYWSAAGPADDTVSLNGSSVTASRTFTLNNSFGLFNSHYADVTSIVAANGNGTFTFSDYLGTIPCGNTTNYGGWMIYIIYGEPTLPQNQISLFDGFDYVGAGNFSLDITLTGIDVATDDLAKIGFLAWEGDAALANQETLTINTILIANPPLNPGNNAFNGTNSYTNSNTLWNMDLDYYDLQGIVQPGDTQVDISLTSGQDLVIVNNIITAVNSEIPDAAISIDGLDVICDNGQNLFVDYTAYNLESTSALSSGTRIDFYWQNVGGGALNYLDTVFTVADIPVNGSESGNTILNLVGTPPQFLLVAVIDPANSVLEIDETNNSDELLIDTTQPFSLGGNMESCEGLVVTIDTGVSSPLFTWQWYKDGNSIPGQTGSSIDVTTNGFYTVEGFEGPCFITDTIEVIFNTPAEAFPAPDLFKCNDGATSGSFDLTQNDPFLLGAQDPDDFFVKYYETLLDSQDDTNEIGVPTGYFITQPSPQTIFARVERTDGLCFDLAQFKIFFTRVIAGTPESIAFCDNDNNGSEPVDLPLSFDAEVLDGELAADYLITYHNDPAEAAAGTNILPVPYNVPVPGELIYARLVNFDDLSCFDVVSVFVTVHAPPVPGLVDPYVVCDADNDGFSSFDLETLTGGLMGGNAGLIVTYHGTELDAQNGVLPLINPYPNDTQYNDSVWARLEDNFTGCYTAVEVFLEVRDSPTATTPAEPLRLCDDALADGFTVFDLTVVAPEVLGGLDPLEYDLYYYELESDAIIAGDLALTAPDFSGSIANPGAYQNTSNPQTIYILLVGNPASTSPNNGSSGCYDIVALELIVDPLPLDLGPFELFLCDDDLNGSTLNDELSTFDLTQVNDPATGGDGVTQVIWYETLADELADNPILTPEAYQNLVTPQTIIGRLESEFGCRTLITLTLTVLPNPTPNPAPTPLEVCDDDLNGTFDDGISTFTLTDKDAEITDGEPDVSVLYYATIDAAQLGIPGTELLSPYTNTTPDSQIIFARVFRDVPPSILPCYTIVALELIVIPLPDAPTADFIDPMFVCDDDGDGLAEFNLTQNDPFVLGVQVASDFAPITYYTSLITAEQGIFWIANPTAYVSGPTTIWVRLESLETECYRISSFDLEVGVFPTIGSGDDLFLCDDEIGGSTLTDGLSTFDLTVNTPEITLGDVTYTLVYYATAQDQIDDIAIAAPSAYQNIITPVQQIFVTVFGLDGCPAFTSFLITVNPNPELVQPDTYIICDPDSDGFAAFDLSLFDAGLTGLDPNLLVTYHGTELNAKNGAFPLGIPYTNDDIYNDSVWARVENATTGCYSVIEAFLEVRDLPAAVTPEPLRLCDDALADGFTVFDLTVVAPEVLGGLDPLEYDLYYYELESDAIIAGDLALTAPDFSGSIANPGAYQNTSNPQTIYILLVGNPASTSPNNGSSGCYDIVALELIVDPLPLDLGPFELFLCDDDLNGSTLNDELSTFDLTQVNDPATGGDGVTQVIWYETLADELADNPILTPEAYQNLVTPQTIIGRLESEFGCRTLITLTLTVLPNPTPNPAPTPLEVCDDDLDGGTFDDGISTFTLTDKDAEIIAGEPDVSVTYYETLAQAEAGTPALTSPWVNTIPGGQVIYARVARDVPPGILGCSSIVPLELIVVALPDAPTADFIDPMFVCDDDGDGLAEFNLTLNDPFVLGTQDPISFAPITYHESLAAAQAGTPFIAIPEAYLSPGGTSIWVRLESLDTGCYRITSFGLVTGALPAIGSAEDLYLCDDQIGGSDPFDGLSTFDLTLNTLEVTLGDPTYSVSYYASAQDQSDGNAITTPGAYQNVISPVQEIFVTVFGPDSCPAVTSFFINVEANPTINIPTPLIVCDDNNNGFYNNFDLTSKDAELLGGQVDVSVRYYETLLDANLGDLADQLLSPYENIVPFVQTIYARLENDVPPGVNACFSIVPLELRIESLPLGVDLALFQDPLVACDYDGDGFEIFDLTQNNLAALGANAPFSDYSVSYYISQGDADLGINAIASPGAYTNIITPIQQVYVRVENFVTGCGKVTPFDLLVEPPADLSAGPFEMVLCDDEIGGSAADDGVSTFDLTLNDAIITGGDPTYTVVYYASAQDQIDDLPIADPTDYQNVVNPQDIYVTVLTSGGCGAQTFLTLRVLPNPSPVTPTPLVVCDGQGDPIIDFDPLDGLSTFTLTDKDAEIIAGEPNVSVLYYATLEEADAGLAGTELLSPYANTEPFNQVVYARVTKDVPPATLACYSIVELELVVSPLPVAQGLPEDLYYCAVDNGGVGVFDLTLNDPLILGDLDPAVYAVLYFRTLTEAQNGVNPIGNPTLFASTTSPQTVYAGLIAIDTGCYTPPQQDPVTFEVDLSFELYVKEGAFAGTPSIYQICDNTAPSDGLAEFTLIANAALPSDLDPQAELLVDQILQGQDPSVYVLTFHETSSDADLGIGALSDVYTNITNPQVIYARVSNLVDPTDEPICYDVSEVLLSVEQMPPMTLLEEYRLCVDAQGNAIVEEFGAASPPLLETGLPIEGFTFLWSFNGTILPNEVGPSIVALQAGTYAVLVTELSSGCSLETLVLVTPASPPIDYNVGLLNGAFAGEHVIEATASGFGSYQFSLDGGGPQDSGIFTGVSPGTHQVTITNIEGCGSVTVDIGVVDYPRFMTPNNDGYNDLWNIIGIADYDPSARIYIFDRYGKLLKQLSPTSQGWDGSFKGNPMPSSDYWFRVEYLEEDVPKAFTGHFTLKR